MGLANSMDDCPDVRPQSKPLEDGNGEIDLNGIDDDEIETYIMSEREAQYKDSLWMKINATYLKEQKGTLLSWLMIMSSHFHSIPYFHIYSIFWVEIYAQLVIIA
jgi:hypothetical protein